MGKPSKYSKIQFLARCSPNIHTNNEQTTHELPLTHPQAASKQFCSFFTHLGGSLGSLGTSLSLFLCCLFVLQALCFSQQNSKCGIDPFQTSKTHMEKRFLCVQPSSSFVSAPWNAYRWVFDDMSCQPAYLENKSFFALQALRRACHTTVNVHG